MDATMVPTIDPRDNNQQGFKDAANCCYRCLDIELVVFGNAQKHRVERPGFFANPDQLKKQGVKKTALFERPRDRISNAQGGCNRPNAPFVDGAFDDTFACLERGDHLDTGV